METLNKQQIISSLKKINKLYNKMQQLNTKADLKMDLMNSLDKRIIKLQCQISQKEKQITNLNNNYSLDDIFTNKDNSSIENQQNQLKNDITKLNQKLNELQFQYNEHSNVYYLTDGEMDKTSEQIQQEKANMKLFCYLLDNINMRDDKFIKQINIISGKDYEYMNFTSSTFVQDNDDRSNYDFSYYDSEQIFVTKQLKPKLEKYENKVEIYQFKNFISKNFSLNYIFDNDLITLDDLKNSLFYNFNEQIFEIFYKNAKELYSQNKKEYQLRSNLSDFGNALLSIFELC